MFRTLAQIARRAKQLDVARPTRSALGERHDVVDVILGGDVGLAQSARPVLHFQQAAYIRNAIVAFCGVTASLLSATVKTALFQVALIRIARIDAILRRTIAIILSYLIPILCIDCVTTFTFFFSMLLVIPTRTLALCRKVALAIVDAPLFVVGSFFLAMLLMLLALHFTRFVGMSLSPLFTFGAILFWILPVEFALVAVRAEVVPFYRFDVAAFGASTNRSFAHRMQSLSAPWR